MGTDDLWPAGLTWKHVFVQTSASQLFRGSKFPTQLLLCSGNGRFSEALKHQPANEPWLFNAQERTNHRKPFLIIMDGTRRTHAEQCSTSTNRKQRHKVFEGWLVVSTFQIYYPVQLVFLFPALRIHNKHKAGAKQWLSRNPSDSWWVSRGSQLVPDQGISSIKHPDLDPAQNLISIHLPVSLIDAANMLPWRRSVVVYRLPQKIQIVFSLVLIRTGVESVQQLKSQSVSVFIPAVWTRTRPSWLTRGSSLFWKLILKKFLDLELMNINTVNADSARLFIFL